MTSMAAMFCKQTSGKNQREGHYVVRLMKPQASSCIAKVYCKCMNDFLLFQIAINLNVDLTLSKEDLLIQPIPGL